MQSLRIHDAKRLFTPNEISRVDLTLNLIYECLFIYFYHVDYVLNLVVDSQSWGPERRLQVEGTAAPEFE